MPTNKPLLFISNDDGYKAKGLNSLVSFLRDGFEIVVVAPDGPRSGASGAITVVNPVRLQLVKQEDGLTIYSCSGTPVDCVKLGLQEACPRQPDVVIGGINHGENDACNVHYSGTMGIVIEGCLKGIPSVGFSLQTFEPDADFSPSLPYCRKIVEKVVDEGLPDGVCLNVNFPYGQPIRGVRVCAQAKGKWSNEWAEAERPRGGKVYWLIGDYSNTEPESEQIDDWAMRMGYVAITPTKVDVTAYETIEKIKSWGL